MKELNKKVSLVLFVLMWVFVGKVAQAKAPQVTDKEVKVDTLELYDTARARPVKVTLWYPAGSKCEDAKICLANNTQLHQAAVMSHGAMGSAQDYNWIGFALASQGIVVVGINHYGESYLYGQEHVDHSAALRFWERPQDVSFVLDKLNKNSLDNEQRTGIFNKGINWKNVMGIGHSSGGATMIAAIGGKVDLTKAQSYCALESSKTDKSCAYLRHLPRSFSVPNIKDMDFKDARISKVIALDPALGHIMTDASLHNIDVPVFIIGSKQNDFLLFDRHAGHYANAIPSAQLMTLNNGEGHFVYLDSCEHEYQTMGVSLCEDRIQVNRNLVHQNAYPHMFKFIYSK